MNEMHTMFKSMACAGAAVVVVTIIIAILFAAAHGARVDTRRKPPTNKQRPTGAGD